MRAHTHSSSSSSTEDQAAGKEADSRSRFSRWRMQQADAAVALCRTISSSPSGGSNCSMHSGTQRDRDFAPDERKQEIIVVSMFIVIAAAVMQKCACLWVERTRSFRVKK